MVKFVYSITRFIKLHFETVFFFVFLFVLTWLGDGKQATVDVVGVAGILCLFAFRSMKGKQMVTFFSWTNAVWATLLGYFLVRTLFSDSVGYSISTTLRWIMAFAVFSLFSSISRVKKYDEKFTCGFLWLGACMVLASWVVTFFEPLGRALPSMNLLYPAYGHNHIANTIVFVFPLVLLRLVQRKNKIYIFLFLLFSLGLVFSFARGAWVLISVYLCYFLFANREISVRIKSAVLIVVIGIIGIFCVELVIKTLPAFVSSNRFFQKQIIKNSIVDNRIPYWQQAIKAVQERPLFGAGPGTFYLLSKRFQETPNSYSWYAHSFPLELASEIGLIGLIGVIWLIGYILRTAARGPLFHGVVLTLVYGAYEMNLNFLVIWFLLWAALGVLFRGFSRSNISKVKRHFLQLSLILLACFYILAVSNESLGFFPNTKHKALLLTPYQTTKVLSFLDTTKDVSQTEISIIEFFHKKNPEVLIALAKLLEQKRLNQPALYYARAVAADPQNVAIFLDAITFNLRRNDTQAIGVLITGISKRLLSKESLSVLSQVDFSDAQILPLYTKALIEDVGRPTTTREFLAKTYYFLGLSLINKDPKRTKALWTLARDSAPDWGYFHVELASLEYHILRNKEGANGVLIYCKKFAFAAQQCSNAEIEDTNPGDTYEYVKAIPAFR